MPLGAEGPHELRGERGTLALKCVILRLLRRLT